MKKDTPVCTKFPKKWLEFRKALNDVPIPRHIFAGKVPMEIQSHVFLDACENAYGAGIDKSGTVILCLLYAKLQIATIIAQTIPRLELRAVKLAVVLTYKVTTDLEFNNKSVVFFTDSRIVIELTNYKSWCYKTFVANGILAILEGRVPEQ